MFRTAHHVGRDSVFFGTDLRNSTCLPNFIQRCFMRVLGDGGWCKIQVGRSHSPIFIIFWLYYPFFCCFYKMMVCVFSFGVTLLQKELWWDIVSLPQNFSTHDAWSQKREHWVREWSQMHKLRHHRQMRRMLMWWMPSQETSEIFSSSSA